MKFGIGQAVKRTEDPRFLTGRGQYVDDIDLPEMLFAQVVRSDFAAGTLVGVDAEEARRMPGVALVYTAADIAGRLVPISAGMGMVQADGSPFVDVPHPHLAEDTVAYVGQPVAVVFANSRQAAMDAAEAVAVEVEPSDAVVSAQDALNAAAIHEGLDGNRIYRWEVGDPEAVARAFDTAHIVQLDVRNQRLAGTPIEPRGIVVRYDAQGWEIWVSNQGVHSARSDIARDLRTTPDRLRVHAPDVGGGFGMKLIDHPEYALCALAAQQTDCPVKWTSTRAEALLSDVQARDLTTRAEAAFAPDGTLLGLRWRSTSNVGAFTPGFGAGVHTSFSAHLIGGVYDVRAVHHVVEGVVTNTTPVDAYRGAGKPEVLHVMERLMSTAARELGLDQVAIRQRNLIRPDQIPYRTAGGVDFDAIDAPAILNRAAELAEVAGFDDRARGKLAGLGVAYYYERTGGGPVEMATIHIAADGAITADVGTESAGQGHETAWAQIVANQLGVPYEAITVRRGDTGSLPRGSGTGGSRSAVQASRSFLIAAEDVVEKALIRAEDLLEVARTDLEFRDGTVRVTGTDRAMTLIEIAAQTGPLDGVGEVDSVVTTTPNGAHIAEVEIDPETGHVTLTRYSVVDDFGNVINPMIVTGQVHGGVAQGAGQVLCEEMVRDANGQPLSGSFMDYAMPRAADLPMIDVELVSVPTPSNPLGLKGCGEAGAVATVGAVANAVEDALARAGAAPCMPPYTPGRVWSALHRI